MSTLPMTHHVPLLGEALPTNRTDEQFFVEVSPHVGVELKQIRKELIAHLALSNLLGLIDRRHRPRLRFFKHMSTLKQSVVRLLLRASL